MYISTKNVFIFIDGFKTISGIFCFNYEKYAGKKKPTKRLLLNNNFKKKKRKIIGIDSKFIGRIQHTTCYLCRFE